MILAQILLSLNIAIAQQDLAKKGFDICLMNIEKAQELLNEDYEGSNDYEAQINEFCN